MARNMETQARSIFRNALFQHYIDGIAAGDDVEQWLKTHGGWFPDEQADYGYGIVMPLADGPDVMSKDPALAMKEAKTLMDRLSKSLGKEENANVLQEVCEWLEHWKEPVESTKMTSSSSAALTEANVEARDFRLDFAHETLQSFKRDRSRSPRRYDDWDAKAAALHLDVKDTRIEAFKEMIESLKATVQSLKVSVKEKDTLIEKARIDDVINKANIDALGDVCKAKDDRIASLEWRLALKARTTDMLHEIINEHCRRAALRREDAGMAVELADPSQGLPLRPLASEGF